MEKHLIYTLFKYFFISAFEIFFCRMVVYENYCTHVDLLVCLGFMKVEFFNMQDPS